MRGLSAKRVIRQNGKIELRSVLSCHLADNHGGKSVSAHIALYPTLSPIEIRVSPQSALSDSALLPQNALHPIRHFVRLCEFPFANLRPSSRSYDTLFRNNMNSFDGISERVAISLIGRKRKRGPDQRQIDKKRRHSGGGKIPQIACGHTAEGSSELCYANRLTEGDILMNFKQFYSLPTKPQQDETILRLMEVTKPRRVRIMEDARQRDKAMSVKYKLMTEDRRKQVPVCKSTFTSVLG